jgi:hypothetical protein
MRGAAAEEARLGEGEKEALLHAEPQATRRPNSCSALAPGTAASKVSVGAQIASLAARAPHAPPPSPSPLEQPLRYMAQELSVILLVTSPRCKP